MTLRKAHPQEAEILWNIRNQAIRHGCKTSYDADVIARWTPDLMPEHYRQMVIEYPFYVVEDERETLRQPAILIWIPTVWRRYSPCLQPPVKAWRPGLSRRSKRRPIAGGITRLTLDATPNARSFYQKLGFVTLSEKYHHSRMAGADLRCFEMAINL